MRRSPIPAPERLALGALISVAILAAAFVLFREGGGVSHSGSAAAVDEIGASVVEAPRVAASTATPSDSAASERFLTERTVSRVRAGTSLHGTSLSGSVLDRDTGAPAVGMRVEAYPIREGVPKRLAGIGPPLGSSVTGADGGYRLSLANASDRLLVFVRTGASEYAEPDPMHAAEVRVDGRDTIVGVDFLVELGRVVRGTVVDALNRPIEGAVVRFLPHDLRDRPGGAAALAPDFERFRRITAVTGEAGTFERRGMPEGVALHAVATAIGFAPASVRVESLDAAPVTIALGRGCAVEGTLVFEDGAPAPGIPVRLVVDFRALVEQPEANAVSDPQYATVSKRDGSFRIEHLPAGWFSISTGNSRVVVPGRVGRTDVRVDGLTDVRGLEVVVARPPTEADEQERLLSGFVVDDTGEPVADVKVVRTGPVEASCHTDDAGEFRLVSRSGVDPWRVRASKEGYRTVRLVVDSDANEFPILVLERAATVHGTVYASDGASIEGSVELTVAPESDPTWRTAIASVAMQEGRADVAFELASEVLGRVVVLAKARHHALARSAPFDLVPGQTIDGIDLHLVKGGTVFGRVVTDARGEPVAGAVVRVRSAISTARTSPVVARVSTDAYGEFRIDDLATGAYEIAAEHPRWIASPSIRVDVSSGSVVDAGTIALADPASLYGRITHDAAPVENALVQLRLDAEDLAPRSTRTDSEGRFELGGLPAGFHVLVLSRAAAADASLTSDAIATHTRDVRIEAGTAVRFDLDLTGSDVRLTGQVTPAREGLYASLRRGASPASAALVDADTDAETRRRMARDHAGLAKVGADGRFAIRDLAPGTYLLEILSAPDDEAPVPVWSGTVEVLDGAAPVEIELE